MVNPWKLVVDVHGIFITEKYALNLPRTHCRDYPQYVINIEMHDIINLCFKNFIGVEFRGRN